MTEEDQMTMIESKEEDAYADRKPKGILKEGEVEEEDEEEDYQVDLSDNCFTLRKTAAFTISRFACKKSRIFYNCNRKIQRRGILNTSTLLGKRNGQWQKRTD
jgi:hypothetical protein